LFARIEPEHVDECVDFQNHFILEAGREPENAEAFAWDVRHDLRRRKGYIDYLERAEDDRRTLIENAERGLHGPSFEFQLEVKIWPMLKDEFFIYCIEFYARPCRFLFDVSLFLFDVSLFLARR
jgi:hypothetical protein